jgi:superoxide dismutase, Fe-Mn family
MYEHSYHMDFGAKAGSYVDCFMEVIHWQNTERRFKSLSDTSSVRTRECVSSRH